VNEGERKKGRREDRKEGSRLGRHWKEKRGKGGRQKGTEEQY